MPHSHRSSSPTQESLPKEGDEGIIPDKVPYPEGPIWKRYATDLAQKLHVLHDRSDEQLKQMTVGETIARANGISESTTTSAQESQIPTPMSSGGEAKG